MRKDTIALGHVTFGREIDAVPSLGIMPHKWSSSNAAQDSEDVFDIDIEDQEIYVEKRNNSLIIDDKCKKIMRNLCSAPPDNEQCLDNQTELTQPSFLSPEEQLLFFKTKMFYLLQERHDRIQQSAGAGAAKPKVGAPKTVAAEAYVLILSPFCQSAIVILEAPAKRHQTLSDQVNMGTETAQLGSKALANMPNWSQQQERSGLAKFLENLRKANQSVLRILDEKILKTLEGAGYSTLMGKNSSFGRMDMMLSIFPDYKRLLLDGKDEESRLNNLVSHVRIRMQCFDKLLSFYDNRQNDDHISYVFTIPNLEVTEAREEITGLKSQQLHQLNQQKIDKLFAVFKDDFNNAKTTLIPDGTQPVVVNRKKLDKVKKYVDECAEWKGKTLVPYIREMNFFFLTFPWSKFDGDESMSKTDSENEMPLKKADNESLSLDI